MIAHDTTDRRRVPNRTIFSRGPTSARISTETAETSESRARRSDPQNLPVRAQQQNLLELFCIIPSRSQQCQTNLRFSGRFRAARSGFSFDTPERRGVIGSRVPLARADRVRVPPSRRPPVRGRPVRVDPLVRRPHRVVDGARALARRPRGHAAGRVPGRPPQGRRARPDRRAWSGRVCTTCSSTSTTTRRSRGGGYSRSGRAASRSTAGSIAGPPRGRRLRVGQGPAAPDLPGHRRAVPRARAGDRAVGELLQRGGVRRADSPAVEALHLRAPPPAGLRGPSVLPPDLPLRVALESRGPSSSSTSSSAAGSSGRPGPCSSPTSGSTRSGASGSRASGPTASCWGRSAWRSSSASWRSPSPPSASPSCCVAARPESDPGRARAMGPSRPGRALQRDRAMGRPGRAGRKAALIPGPEGSRSRAWGARVRSPRGLATPPPSSSAPGAPRASWTSGVARSRSSAGSGSTRWRSRPSW